MGVASTALLRPVVFVKKVQSFQGRRHLRLLIAPLPTVQLVAPCVARVARWRGIGGAVSPTSPAGGDPSRRPLAEDRLRRFTHVARCWLQGAGFITCVVRLGFVAGSGVAASLGAL